MRPWKDKNSGKHPDDPDYLEDYDPEEDYDRYLDEVELREMAREGN